MLFNVLAILAFLSVVRSDQNHVDYLDNATRNSTCNSEVCLIMNSTTCEEFLRGTEFDPNRILNVDWKIFYFWNYLMVDSYQIRFSVPSSMLIERYKILLGDDVKGVNWADVELFMETGHEISGLLMRTNTSGLYRLLSMEMYDALLNMPPAMMALKVVDQYLGFYLNCERRICFALAPVDQMPEHNQLTAAAAKLRFHSELGRSYLTAAHNSTQPNDLFGDDDDQDADWYSRNSV